MAYARFGPDSDVYVYETSSAGDLICEGCSLLGGGRAYGTYDVERMIEHLDEHRAAGLTVPDIADTLRANYNPED